MSLAAMFRRFSAADANLPTRAALNAARAPDSTVKVRLRALSRVRQSPYRHLLAFATNIGETLRPVPLHSDLDRSGWHRRNHGEHPIDWVSIDHGLCIKAPVANRVRFGLGSRTSRAVRNRLTTLIRADEFSVAAPADTDRHRWNGRRRRESDRRTGGSLRRCALRC